MGYRGYNDDRRTFDEERNRFGRPSPSGGAAARPTRSRGERPDDPQGAQGNRNFDAGHNDRSNPWGDEDRGRTGWGRDRDQDFDSRMRMGAGWMTGAEGFWSGEGGYGGSGGGLPRSPLVGRSHGAYDRSYDPRMFSPERYDHVDRGSDREDRHDEHGFGATMRHMGERIGHALGLGKAPKGYVRSDERIREDVIDRIVAEGHDASDVEVTVKGGEVTLTGFVQERRFKHRMEDIADHVSGVKDVHNQIRVKRGETATETREANEVRTESVGSTYGSRTASSRS